MLAFELVNYVCILKHLKCMLEAETAFHRNYFCHSAGNVTVPFLFSFFSLPKLCKVTLLCFRLAVERGKKNLFDKACCTGFLCDGFVAFVVVELAAVQVLLS